MDAMDGKLRRALPLRSQGHSKGWRQGRMLAGQRGRRGRCPEPDLNRYAREGQRGLSSPCLHSTIRAGHGPRYCVEPIGRGIPGWGRWAHLVLFYWCLMPRQVLGLARHASPGGLSRRTASRTGMTGFHPRPVPTRQGDTQYRCPPRLHASSITCAGSSGRRRPGRSYARGARSLVAVRLSYCGRRPGPARSASSRQLCQVRGRSGSPEVPGSGVRTATIWLTPMRLRSKARAEAAM